MWPGGIGRRSIRWCWSFWSNFVRGISPPAGGDLLCPWRLVVAKSTRLRFRLVAKTALVPLILLFPANPLRWASPGGTGEITQNAAGDAADGLRLRFASPRSIGLPPYPLWPFGPSPPDRGVGPGPHYGGYPLRQTKYFRRAKSEWCYAISPAPLGAGLDENFKWCISNAAPGFAEPTGHGLLLTGGLRASPT